MQYGVEFSVVQCYPLREPVLKYFNQHFLLSLLGDHEFDWIFCGPIENCMANITKVIHPVDFAYSLLKALPGAQRLVVAKLCSSYVYGPDLSLFQYNSVHIMVHRLRRVDFWAVSGAKADSQSVFDHANIDFFYLRANICVHKVSIVNVGCSSDSGT